ncbi:PIN domain-containing protein [Xanthomonas cerealis]|uniref:PIN domain-containing protein n=1 Tax=Xanthomonas cerealis TaxID=3390025 RepID=UPI00057930F6|nr:PIN domain-containing protein [Xanthomonas translucens]UKE47059.1 hypothetical protein KHA79_18790 [Xanthomonas translucens pv. cerealis]
MQIFVPDTNFFLQCQPADKIDWTLVTHESDIVLLVVREVRKELDRLKSGGNQRRSKRARTASATLRRLTSENLPEIELRASGPRVALRAAPRPEPTALPLEYRIETPDERIVAEVYAAREMVNAEVTFLSHDSVPLEDTAGLGLPTQVIPEEWLLEPEPSDIERELGDVKRRMKALEGRVPDVVVALPGDAVGTIKVSSLYFPLLPDTFIAAAMRGIRKKHPLVVAPDTSASPSHSVELKYAERARWAKYANDHAQWLTDLEFELGDLPRDFCEDPNGMKLPLSIANHGHAAAENLLIRIEAHGDFHLVDFDALEKEDSPHWYFPRPPAPPASTRQLGIDGLSGLDYLLQDRSFNVHDYAPLHLPVPVMAGDRHVLYWEYDDDRHATRMEGQCADFRHGLRPEEVILSLERNAIGDEPIRGALSILISAANLAEPKKVTFPILIEPQIEDTEALVRDLLKRELDVEIS